MEPTFAVNRLAVQGRHAATAVRNRSLLDAEAMTGRGAAAPLSSPVPSRFEQGLGCAGVRGAAVLRREAAPDRRPARTLATPPEPQGPRGAGGRCPPRALARSATERSAASVASAALRTTWSPSSSKMHNPYTADFSDVSFRRATTLWAAAREAYRCRCTASPRAGGRAWRFGAARGGCWTGGGRRSVCPPPH
jgi:hypothetical protein